MRHPSAHRHQAAVGGAARPAGDTRASPRGTDATTRAARPARCGRPVEGGRTPRWRRRATATASPTIPWSLKPNTSNAAHRATPNGQEGGGAPEDADGLEVGRGQVDRAHGQAGRAPTRAGWRPRRRSGPGRARPPAVPGRVAVITAMGTHTATYNRMLSRITVPPVPLAGDHPGEDHDREGRPDEDRHPSEDVGGLVGGQGRLRPQDQAADDHVHAGQHRHAGLNGHESLRARPQMAPRHCRPRPGDVPSHVGQPHPGDHRGAEGEPGDGARWRPHPRAMSAVPVPSLDHHLGHLEHGDETEPLEPLEEPGGGGVQEDEEDRRRTPPPAPTRRRSGRRSGRWPARRRPPGAGWRTGRTRRPCGGGPGRPSTGAPPGPVPRGGRRPKSSRR